MWSGFIDSILSSEEQNSFQNFFSDMHKQFLEQINMSEEEYSELCRPYISECHAFDDIIKAHIGRKGKLDAETRDKISREEKSMGGESIHRGFYCPSLVQDIVVGNCKRGRLCRADNPKAVYTYYFDSDNRLIAAKGCGATEYISYDCSKSLGFKFCGDDLQTVSECEYDDNGRIKNYIYLLCHPLYESAYQCDKEIYTYNENTLTVEHSSLTVNDPPVLTTNKYVFEVEDGYLKNYVTEVFDMRDFSDEPLGERTRKVRVKRRI